ncbi:hypothetical protein HNP31_000685 [Acinetobacter johnsonii]|jgi:hypothetical protein|nr:hypothetical protein [Acinetobacter johnsonii]
MSDLIELLASVDLFSLEQMMAPYIVDVDAA